MGQQWQRHGNSRSPTGLAVNFAFTTQTGDAFANVVQAVSSSRFTARRKTASIVFDVKNKFPIRNVDGEVQLCGSGMLGDIGDGLLKGEKKIIALFGVQ